MQPFEPQQLPIDDIQWDSLIPLIGKATRSLAYYDGILYGLANPDVLLSPLTTQEAVLSSKIEGTQATLGEVLKFEAGAAPVEESRVRDIEEIMNYRRAMRRAEVEDRVHQLLSERLVNIRNMFGQIPDTLEDVWVAAALSDEEEAKRVIAAVPKRHPFEMRYDRIESVDWESCSRVLDSASQLEALREGW